MSWLAVDVGGANLKLADDGAFASVRPFALWKQPDGLAAALQRMLASAPCHRNLAVTMTGELADCFATKSVGVRHILQQVTQAVPQDWQLRVYLTDGRLVGVEAAWAEPLVAAASNWHALAAFAGRFAPIGSALLIDIGSTTCDLIPLTDGCPAISGSDDTQRLLGGNLLYTGVERSPICAVLDRAPYRGGSCPLAQEYFATMRDAYLMLGDLPENAACCETADGQPATRRAAQVRLARMICADASQFDETDAIVLAEAAALAQAESLTRALRIVTAPSPPATVIASGHGDFLLRRSLEMLSFRGQVVTLAQRLEPGISRVAPAHALAVLAKERIAP